MSYKLEYYGELSSGSKGLLLLIRLLSIQERLLVYWLYIKFLLGSCSKRILYPQSKYKNKLDKQIIYLNGKVVVTS